VKQVVRDLDLPIEIRVVETVRDADGLALSSRNTLLSPEERESALAIPRALATGDATRAHALLVEAGLEPDYVEVADLDGPTLAVAVQIGATRLIDNVPLEGATP
jgi:pantothenate synthetase